MGEPSAKIRERVEQARAREHKRFDRTNLQCNGGYRSRRSEKLLQDRRCGEKLVARGDAADVEDPAKFAWADASAEMRESLA